MHVQILGSETSFDLFFAASSRSNTKVSIGTDEREGSYTSTCQEPPAGKSSFSLLPACKHVYPLKTLSLIVVILMIQ